MVRGFFGGYDAFVTSATGRRACHVRAREQGDLPSRGRGPQPRAPGILHALHGPHATLNGQPMGREGDKHRAEVLAEAFPDQRYEILELVAEGDRLVVRWRMTGAHRGTWPDPP